MDKYLVVNKKTDKEAFILRLMDWSELVGKAIDQNKIPVMSIEIGNKRLWVFDDIHVEVDDAGKLCVTEG